MNAAYDKEPSALREALALVMKWERLGRLIRKHMNRALDQRQALLVKNVPASDPAWHFSVNPKDFSEFKKHGFEMLFGLTLRPTGPHFR